MQRVRGGGVFDEKPKRKKEEEFFSKGLKSTRRIKPSRNSFALWGHRCTGFKPLFGGTDSSSVGCARGETQTDAFWRNSSSDGPWTVINPEWNKFKDKIPKWLQFTLSEQKFIISDSDCQRKTVAEGPQKRSNDSVLLSCSTKHGRPGRRLEKANSLTHIQWENRQLRPVGQTHQPCILHHPLVVFVCESLLKSRMTEIWFPLKLPSRREQLLPHPAAVDEPRKQFRDTLLTFICARIYRGHKGCYCIQCSIHIR